MNFLNHRSIRRVLSAVLSFLMLSSLIAPQLMAQPWRDGPYDDTWNAYNGGQNNGYLSDYYKGGRWDDRGQNSGGQEPGRTIGGSLGLAGGMIGGAALASAVIGAAGIASWGPLAVMLIGSAITIGGAFIGSKLFSHLGGKFTQALGRDNMWMMIGAAAGAIAAIALIPAAGPFAGAAGLLVKGMIGGLLGGTLGKLFAPQMEALATPRNLMLGVGALIGGLGGGIPGAIAGAVGGYVLGAILDDNFFSQPGDSVSRYLPWGDGNGRNIVDKLRDAWDRVTDWGSDKKEDAEDWWDRNYWRDEAYSPTYQQSYSYARGQPFGYDSPYNYNYQYNYARAAESSSLADAQNAWRAEYNSILAKMQSGTAGPADLQRYNELERALHGSK